MHDVGWLSTEQYKKAVAEPLRLASSQRETFPLKADYVAEWPAPPSSTSTASRPM
jgi:membrane carboxypeptidase/penicillin-binding protein